MWRSGGARVVAACGGARGRRLCNVTATEAGGGKWACPERRRAFLEELRRDRGIEQPEEWRAVSSGEVRRRPGGPAFLAASGGLHRALQECYGGGDGTGGPWQEFACRPRVSTGFWSSAENRRSFVRYVERREGIREPADWKRIRNGDVAAHGGASLLTIYGSVGGLLASLEDSDSAGERQRPRLPRGYWADDDNCRRFLAKVAEEMSVKASGDWRNVRQADVRRLGGARLIARFGSLFAAVRHLLPELDVTEAECKRRISPAFWKSEENQRQFLRRVAVAHNVLQPTDWSRVSTRELVASGGTGLLAVHGSLWAALVALFPEEDWSVAECTSKAPKHHWQDAANVAAFLARVKERAGITRKEDWARLSREQLAELGGRSMSAHRLVDLLRVAYPDDQWAESDFDSKVKKAAQRSLFRCVEALIVESATS